VAWTRVSIAGRDRAEACSSELGDPPIALPIASSLEGVALAWSRDWPRGVSGP
jgi:hypothetical protein